jgi:hypothetical protein
MSVHIRRLCSVDDRTGLMDRPSGGGAMEVYDGIGHEHPPKAEIGPIENLIRQNWWREVASVFTWPFAYGSQSYLHQINGSGTIGDRMLCDIKAYR